MNKLIFIPTPKGGNYYYKLYKDKIMPELVMPYGAYKGTKIEDLPTGYLKWVAENFTNEEICKAADDEYQMRLKEKE